MTNTEREKEGQRGHESRETKRVRDSRETRSHTDRKRKTRAKTTEKLSASTGLVAVQALRPS